MSDFDMYVQALMGACDGYAEQAKHAKDDVERKSAGTWHDLYAAMFHGAVLGRAVERGEIDTHTAYNFTLARLLREFAEKVIDSQIPSAHPTYEEAITEYAAKLRLAGEE